MYYALIGDIIASKSLDAASRREAQEKLEAALNAVNETFAGDIAARFLITIGDECQGLMRSSGDPVSAALMIAHAMRPYEIRFAIGAGDIVTAIRSDAAIGADGPAYHRARRVLEAMKPRHSARLRAGVSDESTEEALNTVAALCDRLALGWTSKQEALAYAMLMSKLKGERLTQTELAKEAGVAQSTVNTQLSAAGFNEYAGGVLYIRKILREEADKA